MRLSVPVSVFLAGSTVLSILVTLLHVVVAVSALFVPSASCWSQYARIVVWFYNPAL